MVDKVVHERQPCTVLDVGAGDGAWLAALAPGLTPQALLIGADLAAPSAKPDRVRFVRGDAGSLPVADRVVDAVTARAVLHHVAHPATVVAELARTVAAGGVLVVRDATAMPAAQADELQAYLISRGHPPEPHAGVDPDEVAEAARDAGLRIESLDRAAGTAMLAGPRFATPAFELVATRVPSPPAPGSHSS